MDKIKQKKEKNWPRLHEKYMKKWWAIINKIEDPSYVPPLDRPFDDEAYSRYLVWLGKMSRLYILSAAFSHTHIEEEAYTGYDEMAKLEYNQLVREGRNTSSTRVIRFVVNSEICQHINIL